MQKKGGISRTKKPSEGDLGREENKIRLQNLMEFICLKHESYTQRCEGYFGTNCHETCLHLVTIAKSALRSVGKNVTLYLFTYEIQVTMQVLLSTI